MRIRTLCSALVLLAALLVAYGTTAERPQSVARVDTSSAPATATQQPTATNAPAATSAPTIAPTAVPPPTEAPAPTEAPHPAVVAADTNDTPHLEGAADPQAVDQPVAVSPAQPVRIQIPAIKLDYKPVSVGLDKNRIPIVPRHDVGWYNLSAMPGQGDNIVFWGHVLRFKNRPKIPAPFARVKELKPGAMIILTTAKGQKAYYKVRTAVQVTPDQVSYILPVGKEQVTLVSCIGDNVIVEGSVTKKYRLITIADLVQ